MSEVKRIMISLPDTLLMEVDTIAALEKLNRSEFIREAMKLYMEERKRRIIRDQMKRGYSEMAMINLKIANENLLIEGEVSNYNWRVAEGE